MAGRSAVKKGDKSSEKSGDKSGSKSASAKPTLKPVPNPDSTTAAPTPKQPSGESQPTPHSADGRADSPSHAGLPGVGYQKKIISLVYDFDGTLSPRPMQEYSFLPQLGLDPKEFWAECGRIAKAQSADPLITYMHLMYKKAKQQGLKVDRDDLVRQGASVELYPGVTEWFDAIGAYVKLRAETSGITLRHYLISSGLTEIIEGTAIYPHFHNVFASEYWFEPYETPFPKRVITDTGKTQYLFRINKGIEDLGESINGHMPESDRPIPFSNMIYFGDGETDVPSMALMKKSGGAAIAVHNPDASPKTCQELFHAGRVDFYAPADYRRGSELFKRTCLLLDRILADIRVREEVWGMREGIATAAAPATFAD